MFLNLLCYILIDVFDVFGVMGLVDSYLLLNDPDSFDPYDWYES